MMQKIYMWDAGTKTVHSVFAVNYISTTCNIYTTPAKFVKSFLSFFQFSSFPKQPLERRRKNTDLVLWSVQRKGM